MKKEKLSWQHQYEDFKHLFLKYARAQPDEGTCVLGAGLKIRKDGKEIDFWKNPQQGENGLWKAEKKFKKMFEKLGLTYYHEPGVMD